MVPTEETLTLHAVSKKAALNAGMNGSRTSTNLAVMPEFIFVGNQPSRSTSVV